MKHAKVWGLLAMLIVVLGIWYVKSNASPVTPAGKSGGLSVVTSFYPLYFFATEIGGQFVRVTNLTPPGAEPHDYELTTGDLTTIQKSRLLIINGAGLEPWAAKLVEDLRKSGVTVVSVTDGLETVNTTEGGRSVGDPHHWLDPVLAKQEVEKIADALVKADPSHASAYLENTRILSEKLDRLDGEFRAGLTACRQNNIVTSHTAFGYLAKRYGLTQVAISGLSPDAEPSAKKLAEVSDLVRKKGIRYIFFESLVSPRLAETIARETGAGTLAFNPLEGLTRRDIESGTDYFSVQRQNLRNLSVALECGTNPR
jgi:zinc transport system substrate-binding protein